MLRLTNTDVTWGVQSLNFDLVKTGSLNWRIYTATTSNLTISACNTDSGTASGSLYFDKTNPYIGIGTFSPSKTLHVNGTILGTAGTFGSNASTRDSQLNVLDGTSGTTQVSMRFGNALPVNNCMTMTWNPTGAGSANNYVTFNPYDISNTLTIGCDGRVAVGSLQLLQDSTVPLQYLTLLMREDLE
ncbi:uncharacterized protein PHALS_04889 [Plasmopara halstedii]|uniref:Uncharacterized protein n=1 Tax=Plasmopara halstedii TaxID=4781 RepID=A0A0P1B179_PLAHL|nr:uncharacterized protein PHALS_04889 [Plasmopara halstedii]CEG47746.1 hypothetical protein PHALS_04889 [Plasmopara halstedii]|eukprot:XP_024584115.1 hypothetical protein PHALS_04889 [Plasmopara halstedii]